ncbi:bifunctional tetrahydrofolate synthase/dihydrofolate synthase [Oleiagrimonas sp. C23AA]|uniref:bifunctional tetrahydrofolate synthase/dihydrofolate synthase n=1 Tax=Oleiagrimonas sp. C23AA TaxID=2719047 RepID=UPI00141D90A0|nr:bifunctional tetrahydrofolate synthase/dihydrofolate synthase [Oleiagrimonas sp. C23AA]
MKTLEQWLDYQLGVHARGIDLGLERVAEVWRRLGQPQGPLNIIVGGTNGKGSTVAFLEAMLRAAGYRTGAYTSPHIDRYNERVRIDGAMADDAMLCAAFERIEQARGELPLTYFEFGTLAALLCFEQTQVDVALIEVGLGGRLDAANIVDADVAIVTTVDLDHMDWLGNDRDQIGREKAGIARAGRPVVIGEAEPPQGLLTALAERQAMVLRAGVDFHAEPATQGWVFQGVDGARLCLPAPHMQAPCQRANAAAAITALQALAPRLACSPTALAEGVRSAQVVGRLQPLPGELAQVVDVAHNPQAARALAQWLDARATRGRVLAVFGALADKDVPGVVQALGERIDRWYLADLAQATARGMAVDNLNRALLRALPDARASCFSDVISAREAALAAAQNDDLVLIFGSFFVASQVLASPA